MSESNCVYMKYVGVGKYVFVRGCVWVCECFLRLRECLHGCGRDSYYVIPVWI